MLEQYILTFCHYFDGLGNLIIKLTLEIQYRIKHNDEKIIVHFSNTKYNVLYHLTKFETKI